MANRSPEPTWLGDARGFITAFLTYARGRVRTAVALMVAGAVLEGVGLVLLVPIVGLLIGSQGRTARAIDVISYMAGARTQLERVALLLGVFVLAMVLRAAVLVLRDRRLAVLQLGFVEQQRGSLMRALAAARWSDVAGLRHARVTNAVGTEVQMIAAAAQLMLQSCVTLVMLAAQWLLTLVIAPASRCWCYCWVWSAPPSPSRPFAGRRGRASRR